MKNQGLFLVCLLVCLNGCNGSAPEAVQSVEASPQPQATAEVAKVPPKPAVSPRDPSTLSSPAEAEAAFSAGNYREAAQIARNHLDQLKSDEAPRAEIVKAMEYLANCQAKAGMYDKACFNYAELVKAQPEEAEYQKALKISRGSYWDKELAPKLKEAERLRDKKRFSSAVSLADEVRTAALKAGLSPDPADRVLNSIEKARPTTAQAPASAEPPAPPQPVAKAPVKVTQVKASLGTEGDYPRKGGRR